MLLLVLPQAAGAGAAPDRDLCAALSNLAAEAAATRKPQTVAVISPAIDEIALACQRDSASAAQVAFCDAVMEHVSMEFPHGFPWQIRSCLTAGGSAVKIDTVDEYTGTDRPKIVRLRSSLASGATVDVAFTPAEGDGKPGDRFYGLHGRYELTVKPLPAT
jgi:hypothetical protein